MEAEEKVERKVDHEQQAQGKPYRVTDCLRTQKKGIVAFSFEDMIQQCSDRFVMAISSIRLVLEEDGTEIDKPYFQTLPYNCQLMVLNDGEVWTSTLNLQPSTSVTQNNESHRVMQMVERIRKAEGGSNTKALSQNVTCVTGWLHFSYQNGKYVMVKNTKSHADVGPRPLVVSRASTENFLIDLLKKQFFPRGKSIKGPAEKMAFTLGNCRGIGIADINAVLNTPKPHIYLLSKEQLPDLDVLTGSGSSDSDFEELPRLKYTRRSSPHACGNGQSLQQPFPQMSPGTGSNSSLQALPGSYLQAAPGPSSQSQAMPGPSSQSLPDYMPYINWTHVRTPEQQQLQQRDFMDTDTPTIQFRVNNDVSRQCNTICTICNDRDKSCYLQPCGHTYCMVCAIQLQSNNSTCAICRKQITKVCELYM